MKPFGLLDEADVAAIALQTVNADNALVDALPSGHGLANGLAVRRDDTAGSGWAAATGNDAASGVVLGDSVLLGPGRYTAAAPHGFSPSQTYYRNPADGTAVPDDGGETRQVLFQPTSDTEIHVLAQMGDFR